MMIKNASPKVSVILPAYNAEKFVAQAVESILAQTFSDFELLLIDDGSVDGTLEIIQRFNDPRIRVLRNERNLGLVVSLNRGLAESRGEFIARMDADDWSDSQRFSIQVECLEKNHRLGIVSSFFETSTDWQIAKVNLPITDSEIRHDLLCKSPCFCHPAVMMRQIAVKQAGGYRREWFPSEDRDLWLRILQNWHGANIPQFLHRMLKHEQSISSQNFRRQSGLAIELTNLSLEKKVFPPDIPIEVLHAGWARGELFVAFGLAFQHKLNNVSKHISNAIELAPATVQYSFGELLKDRIASHLYGNPTDIDGVKLLLEYIFDLLPSTLEDLSFFKSQLMAEAYSITAFFYAQKQQRWKAQRLAIHALLNDRQLGRNRGLLKLALGIGNI